MIVAWELLWWTCFLVQLFFFNCMDAGPLWITYHYLVCRTMNSLSIVHFWYCYKQCYSCMYCVIFPRYVDVIEQAVVTGDPVLIENLEETIDPVIDPLLGRHTIKKGRCGFTQLLWSSAQSGCVIYFPPDSASLWRFIQVGDKECHFHPNFRLILHTKLANPHYKPEIQAQTTLINFTVTRDGLEDQLLAEVVNLERPDLELLKVGHSGVSFACHRVWLAPSLQGQWRQQIAECRGAYSCLIDIVGLKTVILNKWAVEKGTESHKGWVLCAASRQQLRRWDCLIMSLPFFLLKTFCSDAQLASLSSLACYWKTTSSIQTAILSESGHLPDIWSIPFCVYLSIREKL